MSLFCDVALPVPLDRAFTYELRGLAVEPGARVLVPFGGQRLVGVVVGVHDTAPEEGVEVKPIEMVLDAAALLPEHLMELARWIAGYYVAPLGEVLRGMLPLTAEVRRQWIYRIGDQGRKALYEAARGSSRRSKLPVEQQNLEYAVLNYLESGDSVKPATIRSATGAKKALLDAMARKRWLVRAPLAEVRDARRVEMVAVAEEQGLGISEQGLEEKKRLPKLNENQLAVMAELAGRGGRALVRELRVRLTDAGIPETTLGTLVKRGLIRLEETAEVFHMSGLDSGKKHAHEHALNEAQTEALGTIVAAMSKGGFRPLLLYGVTGSGKTSVYFAAMRRALDAGKSSLLLVPEIGLTPAMAAQMVAAFGGDVALLHSQLTPDERAEQWHRIRRGEARIVVGTRSAVFAPVPDLGLILVDEEHDGSYKQEETPRYHARDTAVMRAKLLDCPIILGSATPSLESWANADRGRYQRVEMLERVESRPLPVVEMIDMRLEFRETGQEQLFARQLIEETQATLDRGEQVIILLNRRGYSFVVMCRSCGEKIQCENCAISLTYHRGEGPAPRVQGPESGVAQVGSKLECHYCGYKRGVPKNCPQCLSEHLYYMGAGSQQGEERLQELFPGARIGRMDRDTVRTRGDMERLLSRLHSGEINLLVGTQMIAKGHDIHGVTLVGVVGADFALGLPDFRAAERVFQLLTQVSGRAGRGELPGRVLVQSYQPDHYVNKFARTHDYTGFAAKEMYFRRGMRYPPFAVLANVIVQGEKLEEVLAWSAGLGKWFERAALKNVRVLGPAAAPISWLKRIYRYHFILKAERRDALGAALRGLLAAAEMQAIPRRNLVVDVDPVHLM